MSTYIDQKYVALLEPQLTLPKRKSATEIVARCPVCGDSAKNQYKRRFGISIKSTGAVCGCFNCGYAAPLGLFLKDYFPELYNDYRIERFKESKQFTSSPKSKPQQSKTLFTPAPKKLDLVLPISTSHEAMQYLDQRGIPQDKINTFVWVPEFNRFIAKLKGEEAIESEEEDARMVIPLRNQDGKLVGVTSRSLDPNAKLRYENYKIGDDPIIFVPKWIDWSSTIIVTEGIFDALSVPNGIAKLSAALDVHGLTKQLNNDYILCYDNERDNDFIVSRMEKAVKNGHKVFFPQWKYKDLNEALIAGLTPDEIADYIYKHSFKGARALLTMQQWKKGT
jgi:hypothetical protein